MQVNPYLSFGGRCEEALDFYRKALGAQVDMMMRFKDAPAGAQSSPDSAEKIMHASFRVGDSTLMATDGRCGGPEPIRGIFLSITVPSIPDADRVFAALADGGQVQMPLAETFWSPRFGMVADRFGVSWMVNVMH